MLPKGTHDYRKFIRPSELDGWARAAGLTLQPPDRHALQPVNCGRYWLGSGVSVNYLAHCSAQEDSA
jgi:2-polyprenyl-6-hydroxyphenyl methylase/3-demethylubiquinone-9 3-methyltransferase